MKFTGDIFTFTFVSIGWGFIVFLSLGLLTPMWLYWTVKYFIEHTE